jgi:hypothetical protein
VRALFLFLVLANAAFFAWSRYLSPADTVADPAPLGRQIDPQKLRIVGPGEAPAAAAKPAPAPVAAAAAAACLEWGSFTLADAPRAEKALEPLALGPRLSQRRTEELAGWWVFIPPQAPAASARQAALKKAAELKALKVDDYFIVADDVPQRWAISLGVFRTEDAANARLAALRDLGVRSAQAGPRETLVPKIWLQVKGAEPTLEARLREAARQIEGSEIRPCL